MVGRGEITDAAWEQIEPLLPENGRKGGRWRDHRTVIDGILWNYAPALPGATCLNATDPGKLASIASTAGGVTVPGIGYLSTRRERAARWARSNGR
jgi:transposase